MVVSHRGAISFGMVYISVGLYTATLDNDIHFNQLCKENGRWVTLEESPRFAVSRWIEKQGIAFFHLAKAQNLKGIVAKRKDSRYYCDMQTDENRIRQPVFKGLWEDKRPEECEED